MHTERWLLLPLVLVAAFGLPGLYASHRGVTATEQMFARDAVASAYGLLDNPLERLLIRRLVVQDMGRLAEPPQAASCLPEMQPYFARVLAVGWFGVPVAEVDVTCSGANRVGVPV